MWAFAKDLISNIQDERIVGFIFDTLAPEITLHICYRDRGGDGGDGDDDSDEFLYISIYDVNWILGSPFEAPNFHQFEQYFKSYKKDRD
jgi:hypothetical protein